MTAVFLVPLAPMLVFGAIDPQQGLLQQLAMRSHSAAENFGIARFASEPLRLVNFTADVGSYFALAQGEGMRVGWMHVVAAPPLAWCVAVVVARAFGRRIGSPVSLACGAVVATFFVVSVLLYRQFPSGNYAPLHEVLGVAAASAIVDVARLAFRARPSRSIVAAAGGVAVVCVASTATLLTRSDFGRRVTMSMNAVAVRAAAEHLRGEAEALPLYSTTYNLAGVFDALGRGRVHTVDMHDVLDRCSTSADIDACLVATWTRVLVPERLPIRVVVPSRTGLVDKPLEIAPRTDPSLYAAAEALGLIVSDEGSFATAAGVPVIALRRVGVR